MIVQRPGWFKVGAGIIHQKRLFPDGIVIKKKKYARNVSQSFFLVQWYLKIKFNGNLLESFNWFLILCFKVPKPKPLPKCDCRFDEDLNSRQASEGVDWCWLMESPCILLNNEVTSSKATWVDCEKDGQEQINCGGKKTVTRYISYHLCYMILYI